MRFTREAVIRVSLLILLTWGVAGSVGAQSLPSPWTASDIGNPAIAGSSSYSQGSFRIDAAGADIWGTSDQFHFIYQQVSGDVEVIARVDSLTKADAWSKAGLMIRASLSAGSAHGFAHLTAGNGARFLRRTQTGATTTSTAGPLVVAPQWVRIVRSGSTVTAYSSANGTTWTTIGSSTVALGTTAYVGIAVVSCVTSMTTSADVSQVTVRSLAPQPLPAGQAAQDIGGPAVAGSTTYSNGSYTIKAAGSDIWGTADQFRYVYQPVSGDVDVKVRVASISYANAWSKAGVMVRENLTAGSRHAVAFASAGSGYAFQRRIDVNGYSTHTAGGSGTPPGWVRLVRTGNRFEAFRSADGVSWTSMGSDTVPMAAAVYVGIAATSHDVSTATTVVADNLTVTSSPGANQPPTVTLTAPAGGSTYTAPATITMSATAADTDGTIARVDFYRGTTLVASDTTAPYSATWSSAPAGTYSLTAVAIDNAGASKTSAAVSVTVNGAANQPPTVTLTSPPNGGSYTAPATVSLTATASDPEGSLARVEFYSGTMLIYSDTAAPYSFSWQNVAAGTYAIKAIAYDTAGASTASATVTITVSAIVSGPPTTVVFQASPDHATLVTSYRLDIFPSGANPNTATPVATSNLGKPAPAANNDITVDRATFLAALPIGNYIGTVTAIGAAGSTRSTPASFTR